MEDPVQFNYKCWKALKKALGDEKLACHANIIIVHLGRSIESNYTYYNVMFNAWLDYFLEK